MAVIHRHIYDRKDYAQIKANLQASPLEKKAGAEFTAEVLGVLQDEVFELAMALSADASQKEKERALRVEKRYAC